MCPGLTLEHVTLIPVTLKHNTATSHLRYTLTHIKYSAETKMENKCENIYKSCCLYQLEV